MSNEFLSSHFATVDNINGTLIETPLIQFPNDPEDDEKLKDLLKKFDLEVLFETLSGGGITFRSLKYLSKGDIKENIGHVGLQAEFREKLFHWRKEEFRIDDDTISIDSKILSWRNAIELKSSSSNTTSSCSQDMPYMQKKQDISKLLKSTSKGRCIIDHYDKQKHFGNNHRDELINIIIENFVCTNVVLKPSDFAAIVNDIVSLFPTEKNAKEYYYIARKGKKNPSGKLYAKYFNIKTKKKKL